jgi:hypothetical protein
LKSSAQSITFTDRTECEDTQFNEHISASSILPTDRLFFAPIKIKSVEMALGARTGKHSKNRKVLSFTYRRNGILKQLKEEELFCEPNLKPVDNAANLRNNLCVGLALFNIQHDPFIGIFIIYHLLAFIIIFCGSAAQRELWPLRPRGFREHTQRRATVGRTPLD